MTTHVLLSEPSVSESMTTPIGKGREGNRKGSGEQSRGSQVQIVKAVEGRRLDGLVL